MKNDVQVVERPKLSDVELNELFTASWPAHAARSFAPILQQSLSYFGACHESTLVGFVNVAWDGGDHAFLLDPTVLPAWRRRGIGLALVAAAVDACAARGVEWLHVDYDATLEPFYRKAGFTQTQAGLIRVPSRRS
jgi:GNAT superfamily N-acetyltransferase